MKLLIVTQAIDRNDPTLGFFHRWVEEFAKHCGRVIVIALRVGDHDLPDNVRVFSLGKEKGALRLKILSTFYFLLFNLRREYDAVFVHMNPEYVVLGGPLWRLFGKRISLWYTHKSVDLKLRIAACFVDDIFTASREGFRLRSGKVHALGHGIDASQFRNPSQSGRVHDPVRMVSVGRITPIKDPATAIEAMALLRDRGIAAHLTFIGAPAVTQDGAYLARLTQLVADKGLSERIVFAGAVPFEEMSKRYHESDLSINLCPTGGLDKAVLESMAAGVPTVAANRGFADLFGQYADRLLFPHGDARDLADTLERLIKSADVPDMRAALVDVVARKADVRQLIPAIVDHLS